MSDTPDIKLVSTIDLIDELKARFDDFVIAGQRKENEKGRLDTWDFIGDYTNCLGMCSMLQYKINQDRDENSEKLDEAP